MSWDGLDVSRSVFFVFQCGESFKQTRVIESSGEAVWDETVDFLCKTPDETVSITAYSHHKSVDCAPLATRCLSYSFWFRCARHSDMAPV